MKKNLTPFLIVAFLFFQACDDYVNIEPKGLAIASTLEDIDLILNSGAELSTVNGSIIALVNDNVEVPNAILEEAARIFDSRPIPSIYNLQPLYYTAPLQDDTYNTYYNIIGRANYALELLDQNQENNNGLRNSLRGEALLHRADAYFRLVNIYGHHYGLPEASEPESGVPLITVFANAEVALNRSSVNEVYDFILTDINDAIGLLPEISNSNDRPNLTAAYGLLAEVKLHQGDYAEALQNADEALSGTATVLNYNSIGNFLPRGNDNIEVILLKTSGPITFFNNVFATITASIYSEELVSLSDEENDLRLTKFTQIDPETEQYTIEIGEFQLGVTVPKILLLKAECLARSGDFSTAMQLLNDFRENRFRNSFVASGGHILTATNNDEAIAHIMAERRREFNLNGERYFTIKRLNAFENGNISLTRGANTYAPNSINWAAPFSELVINTSTGQIKQNLRE